MWATTGHPADSSLSRRSGFVPPSNLATTAMGVLLFGMLALSVLQAALAISEGLFLAPHSYLMTSGSVAAMEADNISEQDRAEFIIRAGQGRVIMGSHCESTANHWQSSTATWGSFVPVADLVPAQLLNKSKSAALLNETPAPSSDVQPSIAFLVFAYPGSDHPPWAQNEDDLLVFAPPQSCSDCSIKVKNHGAKSTAWWCAQRHYWDGVHKLLHAYPVVDYYFLVDGDTVVFRKSLKMLVRALANVLESSDDLYMGDVTPSWYSNQTNSLPFVMTGGGALVRGHTLRRLASSGRLDACAGKHRSGENCWQPLDWVLGACLHSIGVLPQKHHAFQQFANEVGCGPDAVACHSYKTQKDQLKLLEMHEKVFGSEGGRGGLIRVNATHTWRLDVAYPDWSKEVPIYIFDGRPIASTVGLEHHSKQRPYIF